MTANPRRRRTRHLVGLALTGVLLVVAAVLVAVAVGTLRNSRAGEAVGIDERPVILLPETPNALLAVAGDEGELASLVVMTLLPDGRGGTIVTVPVNADSNAGLGGELVPLSESFEALDFEDFVGRVEGMLALSIGLSARVDADALDDLLVPMTPVEVALPEDVVDSSALGAGIVARAGDQELRRFRVVDALTATDEAETSYDHHDVDVAIWSALAARAPLTADGDVPLDESGEPQPPSDVAELMTRLWEGPIQVRDLALVDEQPEADEGTDVVVVDRRDSLLVFAQIAPALVSTQNPALSFRLEVGYSEEQLIDQGDGLETNSDIARQLIGEILFFQGNVVSVDLLERPTAGAHSVTRISVAQEQFLDDMLEFAPILFGDVDVEVASTLIQGVDVVVTLGTGYLDHEIPEGGLDGEDPTSSTEPVSTEGGATTTPVDTAADDTVEPDE
jgi:hypothetical protein